MLTEWPFDELNQKARSDLDVTCMWLLVGGVSSVPSCFIVVKVLRWHPWSWTFEMLEPFGMLASVSVDKQLPIYNCQYIIFLS